MIQRKRGKIKVKKDCGLFPSVGFQHFRFKNESLVSEMMTAVKMQRQPTASPAEKGSPVITIDNSILKTDSKDIIKAAVVGGVFF